MRAGLIVRPEVVTDAAAVRRILTTAFDGSLEADLVDALRGQARPLVSLVAAHGDCVVGHVVCSPVTLASLPETLLMGLGPVAVDPTLQRQGIGGTLVRAAIDACRAIDAGAMVVLGHPDYYPRFGFVPASRFGLRCTYDVPDEVFMAMELVPAALDEGTGTVAYHPAFPSA